MKLQPRRKKKRSPVTKKQADAYTKAVKAGGILLGDGNVHTKAHEKAGYFVGLWNMERVQCRVVNVKVIDGPSIHEFPWWKPYIGETMQAIEIVYYGRTFYISNEDGSGMAKITVGRGHFSAGHAQMEHVEVLEHITDPKLWVLEYDFDKSNEIAERGEIYWVEHNKEWYHTIRKLRLEMLETRRRIFASVEQDISVGDALPLVRGKAL